MAFQPAVRARGHTAHAGVKQQRGFSEQPLGARGIRTLLQRQCSAGGPDPEGEALSVGSAVKQTVRDTLHFSVESFIQQILTEWIGFFFLLSLFFISFSLSAFGFSLWFFFCSLSVKSLVLIEKI